MLQECILKLILPLTERSAYDLLKAAANNFSCENIIGFGAWSTVYKVTVHKLRNMSYTHIQ